MTNLDWLRMGRAEAAAVRKEVDMNDREAVQARYWELVDGIAAAQSMDCDGDCGASMFPELHRMKARLEELPK